MAKKKEQEQEEILEETLESQAAAEGQEEELDAQVDEYAELQQQLEDALAGAAANKDGWLRAQAEFVNFKKRIEREQAQMHEDAAARVIKRFLGVVDDLDRALANRPAAGAGAEWADGVELVYRKALTILENEGVVPMDVEGQQFDPNLHEAIAQEESPDHESGQIIEVVQKGYLIGERVLRAAMVRVAS